MQQLLKAAFLELVSKVETVSLPVDTKKQGEPPRSRDKHAGRHVRIPRRKKPATKRWQGKLQARACYFPKKKSANACAFGVPTPVTLSQPLFV
jgi:hypothetical protein